MAHMLPESAPSFGPGQRAEKALFDAFANRLDDSFFVYHGLRYHVPGRAGEGQMDFVVLHREHGLLVVECKGQGVRRDGEGRWWRRVDGDREEPLKRSPWEQAQDQVHELVEILRARMAQVFPGRTELPLAFGHAAAFPLARVGEAGLPLDVDRTLLLDADDLARIDRKVMALLAHWNRGRSRTPFAEAEFKKFRKTILHPLLRIAPSLGGRIAADEETFVRLSLRQCEILDMVLGNHRLRVTGGAGTGKTVLALEAVRKLAGRGAEVLFLCFNRPLADLVAASLATAPNSPVQATNFHRLCAQAASALGKEYSPPPSEDREAARRFWEEEAPALLLDALTAGLLPRFDAVVVDEAQDFASEWWQLIQALLRDPGRGHLVIFEDPAQEIFGRTNLVPEGFATVSLRLNFRNTKRIGDAVRRLGRVEMEMHPECPEGDPPSIFPLGSPARNVAKLTELVSHLVDKQQVRPDQIAILTPHSRRNSSLAGVEALGPHLLAFDPSDREGRVLHATFGRFKGLESDVVVLCDVDPADPRCNRNARYVAASRARHALLVLARGDWMAETVSGGGLR
ncbi:MAG: AAA family ATPase [Deltaproteobacteria bacterium]|nr:AAA family ATPase [Deltaproteobacteria bacterium]